MANHADVGRAFVTHYYTVFDSDRTQLGPLYDHTSMLSFEGAHLQGGAAIVEKLRNLQFQTVAHKIGTLDTQPTVGGGILVFVCGHLVADGEAERPLMFSQTFHLMPTAAGGYFVLNDMFRLNYS